MRVRQQFSCKFFLLFFVGSFWAVYAKEDLPLSLSTFQASIYSNPYKEGDGIAVSIVREAFNVTNTNISVSFHDFVEALNQLDNGNAIGTFPIYLDSTDLHKYKVSQPLMPLKLYVYRLDINQYAKKLTEGSIEQSPENKPTQKKKICIPISLSSYVQSKNTIISEDYDVTYKEYANGCFSLLYNNQVDEVIDEVNDASACEALMFQGDKKLIKSDQPILEAYFHLLFKKDSLGTDDILSDFNRGLDEIKKNGVYKTTFDQFKYNIEINK